MLVRLTKSDITVLALITFSAQADVDVVNERIRKKLKKKGRKDCLLIVCFISIAHTKQIAAHVHYF